MSCNCKNRPDIGRGAAFCCCEKMSQPQVMEGCFKLHENDWLEEFPDNHPTDIFEVRFKNTRRSYFRNVNNLDLRKGDIVAVEAASGHDIGIISLAGDMVARQMRRVGFNPFNGEYKKIYRKAKAYDIERWQEAIAMEHETMILSRQIAADMGLNMKIGDVEYQGDKLKAIFYYIADERVDFRELIKVFADRFHVRIEMKQIGARQEAGRIGGIGACGRELCCASWIANFSSVTTNAARVQEISLNPQKLAGQCSKLKCCMMYEYDSYVDARKSMPRLREPLQAIDGEYYLIKSDILAHEMSFSSSRDAMANVVTIPVSRVREILSLNRAGKKVDSIMRKEDMPAAVEEPTYRSQEDSITRFDSAKGRNNRKGKGRNNRSGAPRQGGEQAAAQGVDKQSDKPQQDKRQDREPKVANQGGERPARPARRPKPRREGAENAPRVEGAAPEARQNREGGRPERAERAPRPEKTERTPRPERVEGAPRAEKPARSESAGTPNPERVRAEGDAPRRNNNRGHRRGPRDRAKQDNPSGTNNGGGEGGSSK